MRGWIVPPPKEPEKSPEELWSEREGRVASLVSQGFFRSDRMKQAMLKVRREDFVPRLNRDYAYLEVPLPLPGERSTISCPHSYPLFYDALDLSEGHRFLEVGLGSGYGTALAREVVGPDGLVVSIEIDPVTFEFARSNLEAAGYDDVVLVLGDGGHGAPDRAPFDRICVTAACPGIPQPLLDQLADRGRLIAPLIEGEDQRLTLLERTADGLAGEVVCDVLYVPLQGAFGVG